MSQRSLRQGSEDLCFPRSSSCLFSANLSPPVPHIVNFQLDSNRNHTASVLLPNGPVLGLPLSPQSLCLKALLSCSGTAKSKPPASLLRDCTSQSLLRVVSLLSCLFWS